MTGARYETCRECGLKWNVSKQAAIPWSGCLCPVCRGKYERGRRNVKVVQARTPGAVAVDFGAIPSRQSDTMCQTLISCVGRLFENPAAMADYKRWQKERRQKTKGANA